jgi:cystathionine beta-lyase/cystathionine gamma-synthase
MKDSEKSKFKLNSSLETRLQHNDCVALKENNRPLVSPIYQSTKFTFDTFEAMLSDQFTGYFYSRVSNPTVRQLEVQLAALQGRDDAFCVGSGVASLSIPFMALLKKEDHVILFTESYMPTRYLIRDLLAKFGVTHTILPMAQVSKIENHIVPGKTRLIAFESPTNPSLSLIDLKRITSVAKEFGVLTLLDNTLAGFHNHGAFDVDVFCHSLTKYASGHGDVMGGAIIANESILSKIRQVAWNVGATLDPHAAYLILRGMKTYALRYRQSCESAQKVAEFLASHREITRVFYPGLATHPQFALAKLQMKDFGSIVTCELKNSQKLPEFFNRLNLFILAGSLGSTESLIAPAKRFFGSDLSPEQQREAHLNDGTFRLSIGLESAQDLIRDLEEALAF